MSRMQISRIVLFGCMVAFVAASSSIHAHDEDGTNQLTRRGSELQAIYSEQMKGLKQTLMGRLPDVATATTAQLEAFLANSKLDADLTRYVVLHQATPAGLALFAQRGQRYEALVESLLSDPTLRKQMLVADGAQAPRKGKTWGPAQYGKAMHIYSDILGQHERAKKGLFQRLALAISLEHAVPVAQTNPTGQSDAPANVDPVKRYRHYEKAYLDGELDAAFGNLSTWELRMVVNGDEPDEILTWGRQMLRDYRPDHVQLADYGWRYVKIVGTDVKYGSQNVKHDRPDLQKYQNILMNGGVCGRRAFFGRFILRAFGIPTTARPSRGHAALAHWTPEGWVVNLGGGWGAGWTSTRYRDDLDFLATTQARGERGKYLQVKRAQWAGDVMGEKRVYGEAEPDPSFWQTVSLKTQRRIIEDGKNEALAALGEELGEADGPGISKKGADAPVDPSLEVIQYEQDGAIRVPSASFNRTKGTFRDVQVMPGFSGGTQVFLPRFFPQGQTIMRGGTWKGEPAACTSGKRMLSAGYGRYENWGLRVAASAPAPAGKPPAEKQLDLGQGVTMDLVYIPAGKFLMGGENEKESRFECVEVPRHEVELTQGFYLGKFEVTQAQYEALMGANPSRSTKSPDCPVDNVGVSDAQTFCGKLAELTGIDTRLPTEAEWEYASRGGRETTWFFGEDPAELGKYAWYKGNAEGHSHPVGKKAPNPWGLYDIYGNVNERISDTYAKNYYATSPRTDPTGPSQGSKSRFEYTVRVPEDGDYALTAEVVTANADQRINLLIPGQTDKMVLPLPFTEGAWGTSAPVTVALRKGENRLQFWRDEPPQYGVALRGFDLKPIRPTP